LADTRFIAPTICSILGAAPPSMSQVPPLGQVRRDLEGCESLLVVVFDGFGVAAWRRLRGAAPQLGKLAERRLVEMHAVPPPKTPVNFASMATGASIKVHRVAEKTDPIRAETIFEVLRDSGLSTCVAARASGSPAHLFSHLVDYPAVALSNTDQEVFELAERTLSTHRPNLTLVQFLDIDGASHKFGPFSQAALEAVSRTDFRLRKLLDVCRSLRICAIVLADHGQHEVCENGAEGARSVGRHDGTSPSDFSVPLTWASWENLTPPGTTNANTFEPGSESGVLEGREG